MSQVITAVSLSMKFVHIPCLLRTPLSCRSAGMTHAVLLRWREVPGVRPPSAGRRTVL